MYYCGCKEGYEEWVNDHLGCSDIDECILGKHDDIYNLRMNK